MRKGLHLPSSTIPPGIAQSPVSLRLIATICSTVAILGRCARERPYQSRQHWLAPVLETPRHEVNGPRTHVGGLGAATPAAYPRYSGQTA